MSSQAVQVDADGVPVGPDSWAAFTARDLQRLLYGDDDITGYFNYERAVDLERDLDLEVLNYFETDASAFLERFYEAYENYKEGKYIGLYSEEKSAAEDDDGWLQLPYETRGSPSYRARVGDEFDALEDAMNQSSSSGVHVRLSTRASHGISPLTTFISMKDILNEFLSWLTGRLGERPPYLWVIEPTERGHAHYHLLFPTANFLIPKEEIDEWWIEHGMGTEAGVFIERLNGRRAPEAFKNYLVKYLGEQSDDVKWIAMMILTRKRGHTMSRKLREWVHLLRVDHLKTNSGPEYSDWEYIGAYGWEFQVFEDGLPPPDEFRREVAELRGELHWLGNSGRSGVAKHESAPPLR